jgi:hypothetical protein
VKPVQPYVLASWIGMLPATLLYVYLGAAGKAGLNAPAGQPFGHSPWEYVLFGTGLIATVVVTWVTRITQRELSKSESEPTMKASLLSMLAKLAFAFEGGAVAVPGSTIRSG